MTGGPLSGVKVLEFTGLGPAPFAGMLLSDMGAEVLRIDRPGAAADPRDPTARGRTSLCVDLKSQRGVDVCLALAGKADVLIEGFRPGVMERLGLGPDALLEVNPRLVYGRMTGWGQTGPLAQAAGHDINYIALSGALAAIGPAEGPPIPPLNLVGDYGGGALYLAFGVAAALFEAQRSGRGQVIDAAVLDGAASMMAIFSWFDAVGLPSGRGRNFLGGAAPYYRAYACADGKYLSVGSFEPHFYAEMVRRSGAPAELHQQPAEPDWSDASDRFAALFRTRPRDEWCALLEGTDACVAPVLGLSEAPEHPHNKARGVFVEAFGVTQPAPAPRFSRTPGAIAGPPPSSNQGGAETALRWGLGSDILAAAAA